MTPPGIEPATFRSVKQHLNHCASPVPLLNCIKLLKYVGNHEDGIVFIESSMIKIKE